MPCSACAHDNPPDARFCGACGEPQKRGLIRPGTVSLALPYPPALVQNAARIQAGSFGDETLAGVGITSPKKTWAVIGISSALLFVVGALAVYVSVSPRGPAAPDAPVLIAAVEPSEDEELPSNLPAELPEGVDLDALLEQAVPSPAASRAAPEPILDAAADTPATPDTVAATPGRTPRQPARAPSLPPTYPAVAAPATPVTTPTPIPTFAETTTVESPYTATTYGPAARRVVSTNYMSDIEGCFGAADGRSPGFSGTILVAYMLTQTGQVAGARIARNTTGDEQLGTCLTSAGRGWSLPPPPRRTLEFSMSFSR